jgi:preprotein translocase subunit SecF
MEWYGRYYKALFLIPLVLVLLSVGVIVNTISETGTFVNKGVTLSGGVSATVTLADDIVPDRLRTAVQERFPQADVHVRTLGGAGLSRTLIIDASEIHEEEQEAAALLRGFLEENYAVTSISVETTGPSLGAAFFAQTIIGILLAFLWMGWVIYLYFGDRASLKIIMGLVAFICTMLAVQGVLAGTTGIIALGVLVLLIMVIYLFVSVPSGAVILAAASTILFTVAVINLLGVRLSTAGVAAFLMLIGYSVDTDILLSTRVLKSKQGTVAERIHDAFTTGITMQATTTVAVLVAWFVSSSEVISQIMLIIFIGMVGDIIFTWLQNAGIIYWYMERQNRSHTVSVRRAKS